MAVFLARMIRNKQIKKNWNVDDIVLLLWVVSKYIDQKETIHCESFVHIFLFRQVMIGSIFPD